jgi:hypothetical protein
MWIHEESLPEQERNEDVTLTANALLILALILVVGELVFYNVVK